MFEHELAKTKDTLLPAAGVARFKLNDQPVERDAQLT
jgi:hypothetical protein